MHWHYRTANNERHWTKIFMVLSQYKFGFHKMKALSQLSLWLLAFWAGLYFLSSLEIHFFFNFELLSPQKHKSCLDTEGWTRSHSRIALNVMYLVPSTKPYKTGKLIYYSAIETTCKFLLPSYHPSLSPLTINNFQFQELRSFHCATSFQNSFVKPPSLHLPLLTAIIILSSDRK